MGSTGPGYSINEDDGLPVGELCWSLDSLGAGHSDRLSELRARCTVETR